MIPHNNRFVNKAVNIKSEFAYWPWQCDNLGRMLNILLPFGVFVTSIFWAAGEVIPFEVPKVIFFEYFVKVLALVFAYIFLTKHRAWNMNGRLIVIILAFILWSLIASVLGVDVVKSFAGNYYRKDGLVTLYHLIGFSFLVSFFWKEELKKKVSLAFFLSSIVLSILTTYEIAVHKFGLGSAATFGNPNFLAGYLAVSLPFCFYLFKESNKRVYLLGILFISIVILLIGATAGILTLILSLILYFLFFVHNKFKSLIVLLLSISSILIVGIWARNYYIENLKVFNTEGRARIFTNVFVGFTKRPVLGYGWSNVDYAFNSNVWPLKFSQDIYVDKAHSELLEILVTTGVPGLIIYVIFIGLLFKTILSKSELKKDKLWRFTLLSLLILYLFHAQTNITSIAEQMIFWLVVGITLKE